MNVKLLPQTKLIRTGPVDHADWNYRPILGQIQRLRFSLALSLLPAWSERLLEVGYGSGVLMPALRDHARELYGIDVHPNFRAVEENLASEGIVAHLSEAKAEELPFADNFFDSILAVSSLEFVSDLNQACLEIRRVLRPGGSFVVITPGQSPVIDFGLRILTTESAKKDFGDSRKAIIPTLSHHFVVESTRRVPRFTAGLGNLYHAFRLSKEEVNAPHTPYSASVDRQTH